MHNSVNFREARIDDLHKLVLLLEDDPRGKVREDSSDLIPYEKAFRSIESDPNHQLLIAEVDHDVVGCVQISFLPGLSFKGSWRAELEGVRIRSDYRGKGIGKQMIQEAIKRARAHDCHIIQLTSNQSRRDAIGFYKQLGFEDSHVGMKKMIFDTEK